VVWIRASKTWCAAAAAVTSNGDVVGITAVLVLKLKVIWKRKDLLDLSDMAIISLDTCFGLIHVSHRDTSVQCVVRTYI
jgi:hypothetical protein